MVRSALPMSRFVATVSLSVVACSAPGGPESASSWTKVDAGGPESGRSEVATACTAARAGENLPPRIQVLNFVGAASTMAAGARVVQVPELFDRFNTLCGRCHVATANGGRQLNAATWHEAE